MFLRQHSCYISQHCHSISSMLNGITHLLVRAVPVVDIPSSLHDFQSL